jgi:hypothetical protein
MHIFIITAILSCELVVPLLVLQLFLKGNQRLLSSSAYIPDHNFTAQNCCTDQPSQEWSFWPNETTNHENGDMTNKQSIIVENSYYLYRLFDCHLDAQQADFWSQGPNMAS